MAKATRRGTRRAEGLSEMPGDSWKYLALVGEVGLILAASIGGGLLAGVVLDRWLRTEPVLTVVFIIVGIAAGLLQVFRVNLSSLLI